MDISKKIGTCQDMCPLSEITNLSHEKSPFECDRNGKFKPELAIKTYHRSDAGKQILNSDLRPLPVLVKTLNHIINYVIGEKTNKSPETSEIHMYNFVRDRLRSIRSDITTQGLKGEETIKILETSLLFFIWAGTRFNMESEENFVRKQNLEQITQTTLSLCELYDTYMIENSKHYPSEPFFRAIDLTTNLTYPGYMAKLLSFPDEIINSKYVQSIIEIKKSILSLNISRFFSILDRVPIQMASYILQMSRVLWEDIGYALFDSFRTKPFSKTFLTDFLKIPSDCLNKWYKAYAIQETENEDYLVFDVKAKSFQVMLLPHTIVPDKYRKIPKFNNPIDFLNLDEDFNSIEIDQITEISKPEVSQNEENESIESKKETAQPVAPETKNEIEEKIQSEQETDQLLAVPIPKETISQEEPSDDQEKEPMSPPEPEISDDKTEEVSMFLNESSSSSQFPKLSPKSSNRISVFSRESSKKNLIADNPDLLENGKISIKEVMAMVPYKIPQMSYCCVLLVANDESYNSTIARSRFSTKNGDDKSNSIVFCEKFTSKSETCYILISKNIEQPGVTSIVYCDDSEELELSSKLSEDIPLIKFDSGIGFSPILTFNSCLRKAIEKGITEIRPFNLSDLVKNIFSNFLNSISYTSWQLASANAVFKILNMGLISISEKIIDESFTKFILPFEYHEFEFDELKQYAEKIKSLQFDLIDNVSSKRPIGDTTWPNFIKSRTNISFPTFMIPLSVKFDQNAFIKNIMSELPFEKPSEIIFYQ